MFCPEIRFGLPMNLLDEEHFSVEVENGVKNGCFPLAFELEPETIAIQEAVRVILKGLGEDLNREGIKKTPFRVAKALRQGTRGNLLNLICLKV